VPVDRPRDASGRARNDRERDAAGRPLPAGVAGVERIPDDVVLPPREALVEAQRLIDDDRPFHAHEVLESSWKAAPAAEKPLWRALAQLAVGLTHAQRGNLVGATALLRRGAAGLRAAEANASSASSVATEATEATDAAEATAPYDIPIERLCADASRLADLAAAGRTLTRTLRLLP
jgi:hypothetical protein